MKYSHIIKQLNLYHIKIEDLVDELVELQNTHHDYQLAVEQDGEFVEVVAYHK